MTAQRCPECRAKMHQEQDFCPNFLNHRSTWKAFDGVKEWSEKVHDGYNPKKPSASEAGVDR